MLRDGSPEQPLVVRVVDAAVAPRVAAQEPPAGEHRAADEPVLAQRVERVLRAGRVVLAGAGREQPEACSATRRRGRGRGRPARAVRLSRRRLREDLVDALAEPVEAARARPPRRGRGARRARSRWSGGSSAERRAPGLAQLPLDPVAHDRRPTAFGTARPSRGSPRRPRARTSRGRGSASRPSGPGGRRRRSRASGRGGGGAARACPAASGREALAAPRAAALEDRAAGAGRHPGAEAVLALPPAHVGLVGPLHRVE